MALVTANKVSKSFGAEDIFWDITASVPHGSRIALVGPNGAGKTTLLRILVGLDSPSGGGVHRARNLAAGYLPQEAENAFDEPDQTIWQAMMAVFAELRLRESNLREMERQMALLPEDGAGDLLERYGTALDRFEHDGGYRYEQDTRQVLQALGFAPQDYEMPIAHLSGGQKTRALLARLLLLAPDLLVLDEPTNHLDIKAIEWLENQLAGWQGALLIVSHDRYFLDKVVNRVWELNLGELEVYRGNYSAYLLQRQERYQRRLTEYQQQQALISREEDFIRRNISGQRTREAQGRLKRLERLKRDNLILSPVQNRRLSIRYQATRRSGELVLRTHGLAVGFAPESPLFTAQDIVLRRAECAALIGPNGAGKTTFLRTILGHQPPLSGEVRLGASLQIGYLAQTRDEIDLAANRSVLDEFLAHFATLTSEARDYLARFLFSGDDVHKSVQALSGGERGRLALALLMRQDANVLLLDEPTNHLDIPAQEVLERVLDQFQGTLLLVSHDRYLVSRLATQIWHLDDRRLGVYPCTYQEFLVAREREAAERGEMTATRGLWRRPDRWQAVKAEEARRAAKELENLEQTIERLEARLAALAAGLEVSSAGQEFDKVRQLGLEYQAVEADLELHLAEWEKAADG
jgi:ATP-binding cassette subfamily F protein 3